MKKLVVLAVVLIAFLCLSVNTFAAISYDDAFSTFFDYEDGTATLKRLRLEGLSQRDAAAVERMLSSERLFFAIQVNGSAPVLNVILSPPNGRFGVELNSMKSQQLYSYSVSERIRISCDGEDALGKRLIIQGSSSLYQTSSSFSLFTPPDICAYVVGGSYLAPGMLVTSGTNSLAPYINTKYPINLFSFETDREPVEHNFTINYRYENGSQAAFPYTKTIAAGTSYSVTAPRIEGYTADKPVVSGTMPDKDLSVTVTYTRNIHDLTINYVYEDGSKALDSVVRSFGYDDPYHIPSPSITGYTPDQSAVVGMMRDRDVVATVTYIKDADPDPPSSSEPDPPSSSEPDPPSSSEPDLPDPPKPPDIDMDYVVFSQDDLMEMSVTLWYNLGSIASIALYVFLLVLGIYTIIHIVDYLGR